MRYPVITSYSIHYTKLYEAAAASRLSALEGVHNRRDWASSGVRAVLHNYSGKGNGSGGGERGIVGVVGELIETDAAYERAVEAVLGERIQSIVVRDHSEGLSALQYLKESREGRGFFVPVTLRSREESVITSYSIHYTKLYE